MKKRNTFLVYFMLISIGFGIGFFVGKSIYQSKPVDINIQIPDSIIQNDVSHLDSLNQVDQEMGNAGEKLRDSIQVIRDTKYIKVNEVKKLPVDSGILYLKQKMEKYEKN